MPAVLESGLITACPFHLWLLSASLLFTSWIVILHPAFNPHSLAEHLIVLIMGVVSPHNIYLSMRPAARLISLCFSSVILNHMDWTRGFPTGISKQSSTCPATIAPLTVFSSGRDFCYCCQQWGTCGPVSPESCLSVGWGTQISKQILTENKLISTEVRRAALVL